MIIQGYLSGYDGETLTISAPFEDGWLLKKQGVTQCEIRLDDGRSISAEQRKKIYATMRDISLWTGFTPDEVKALMKYSFIAASGAEYFSLSDVDMTTAREFLSFLIEFCVENGIEAADSLLERSPDIARYLYACLLHKRCCICGGSAELHHVDAVGSGRNRKEIIHKGMLVLPLCRLHHTEIHKLGKGTFFERYHVYGIKLDNGLCQVWKVRVE